MNLWSNLKIKSHFLANHKQEIKFKTYEANIHNISFKKYEIIIPSL